MSAEATGTLREAAIAQLRKMILDGDLRPGQRLTENHLIELLGVSRTTVRDAVQYLVHEGLLDRRPYIGARVVEIDAERIRQVAHARFPLELLGAQRINRTQDEASFTAMQAALDAILDAQARQDPETEYSEHLEFHRLIWLGAKNDFLMELWPPVVHQISSHMLRIQQQTSVIDVPLHQRLLSAIRLGTPYDVQAELHSHIVGHAEQLAASVANEQGKNPAD